MKDRYINLLMRQIEEIGKIFPNDNIIYEVPDVETWKSSTVSILETIYGQKTIKIERIKDLNLRKKISFDGPDIYYIDSFRKSGRSILETYIYEMETLGIPGQKYEEEKSGINLTVSQIQTNNQEVNLSIIINEIRKELTGKQLEEIQNFIDSDDNEEEKKMNVINKLKEFGVNTLSNIVAGILTNPSLYS